MINEMSTPPQNNIVYCTSCCLPETSEKMVFDEMRWDGERQTEFLKREYDWRENKVEAAYKGYKYIECKMPGVHDYAKFVKRGFGRVTDQVCIDVCAGLMSREEGVSFDPRD